MREFDVVFLGAGSAAESAVGPLLKARRTVAVVEQNRVGGECAYVACMPSKALLRSASVRRMMPRLAELGAMARSQPLDDAAAAFAVAARRRDEVAENRDDSGAARGMEREGVAVIRGRGRVLRPGVIDVAGEEIHYGDVVFDTGSTPVIPPIPGLDAVPTWTSDQALSSDELPPSLVVLGGSAVGCELAQVYAAFGARVTLVELSPHLLPKEEPSVADILAAALRDEGIDVRLGVRAVRAEAADGGLRLHLDDSSSVEAARLLIAAGRRPSVDDIGLAALGIKPGRQGALEVTEHCRVRGQKHAWACGDVTAIVPYTHGANHQGRVVADNILGLGTVAEYRSIPRAVYTDPVVASVGLTAEEGRKAGISVITASVDFADLPRAVAEGATWARLVLNADRHRGLLIGMSAVGPHADDLVGEAALAIHARVPVGLLAEVIHPFPTFGQAYEQPLAELADQIGH